MYHAELTIAVKCQSWNVCKQNVFVHTKIGNNQWNPAEQWHLRKESASGRTGNDDGREESIPGRFHRFEKEFYIPLEVQIHFNHGLNINRTYYFVGSESICSHSNWPSSSPGTTTTRMRSTASSFTSGRLWRMPSRSCPQSETDGSPLFRNCWTTRMVTLQNRKWWSGSRGCTSN